MTKYAQQWAAFSFGVSFIVIVLLIAIFIKRPTDFQIFVFRVVLAMAAAGAAAMIPGFLNVQVGTLVRAGGAIAVFVVIYFLNPATVVASNDPGPIPNGDARQIADQYLQISDRLEFEEIWAPYADDFKSKNDKSHAREAFMSVRGVLGNVKKRSFVGTYGGTNLPGAPSGNYRVFTYSTLFENRSEAKEIVTIGSEDGQWRLFGHNIAPK